MCEKRPGRLAEQEQLKVMEHRAGDLRPPVSSRLLQEEKQLHLDSRYGKARFKPERKGRIEKRAGRKHTEIPSLMRLDRVQV